MLRVGFVPYVNAYPFRGLLHAKPPIYEEEIAPPIHLSRMLIEGYLDIGLCSSLLLANHSFDYLPKFGIGSENNIASVVLYHSPKRALCDTHFYLDPHSLTSNSLFYVLARHYWDFEPKIVSSMEKAQGFLRIGDFPLKNSLHEEWVSLDLGGQWHAFTGLPFVYALFLYNPEMLGPDRREELESFFLSLHFSYEAFLNDFQRHLALFSRLAKLPSSTLEHYYSLCQHRLSERHIEGLELFLKLAEETHVLTNAT